jgi:hypothetical protein
MWWQVPTPKLDSTRRYINLMKKRGAQPKQPAA